MAKNQKKKYTPAQMIAAIQDTGGIKAEICSRLGCARATLDRYLEEYEEVRDSYREECDRVTDMARGALFECIESRQPWAIMFYLERRDPAFSRKRASDGGEGNEESSSPVSVKIVIEDARIDDNGK